MELKCKKCGGSMSVSKDGTTLICPYCGETELIDESDAVKIQKIKTEAYKEIESKRLKHESERLKHEIDKEERNLEKDEISVFKKGKLSKILIVFFVISLLVTLLELSDGVSISGLISLSQCILYISAWLVGMKIIKTKYKNLHFILALIGCLLIIPFFWTFGNAPSVKVEKEYKQFEWSEIEMREHLPEPKSFNGYIYSNSEDYFSVDINNYTGSDYKEYLQSCQNYGYTIEPYKSESMYSAYSADGYDLSIHYDEDDKVITIRLNAPEKMNEFEFPTNGIAALLPVPKSNIGRVTVDKSDAFTVRVGNTSKEDYDEYVKLCESVGFNVDYNRYNESYSAENSDGFELEVRYLGFNRIEISIKAPVKSVLDKVNTNEPETEKTIVTSAANDDTSEMVDGMRKEFKDALDSYEKFFDEYVEFMKKYSETENSIAMLTDYLKFMTQYADTMEKLDDLDDGSLNEAEEKYYLEVTLRINQKLLSAVS